MIYRRKKTGLPKLGHDWTEKAVGRAELREAIVQYRAESTGAIAAWFFDGEIAVKTARRWCGKTIAVWLKILLSRVRVCE